MPSLFTCISTLFLTLYQVETHGARPDASTQVGVDIATNA